MIMCNKTEFKTIPLRYMCGILFINFRLLWDPTLKVIESHAHGLNVSYFWNVYGEELKKADCYIDNKKDFIVEKVDTSYSNLEHVFENWQLFKSKPDFVNYRLLLWKGLQLFPDIAEMKTRDVSELLLSFYEKEFMKHNPDMHSLATSNRMILKLLWKF
ncbi:hypothetical protein WA026_016303 [Henosepilachna vigintioctopunctata]|uniref:Uncharacterized protein n=1 Tax=Henosepilachna vigintioctopunctata TaxID=420089 RepID=A0AAW1UJK5_9CUCU